MVVAVSWFEATCGVRDLYGTVNAKKYHQILIQLAIPSGSFGLAAA